MRRVPHIKVDRQFFRGPAGVGLLIVTALVLVWSAIAFLRPWPGRHLSMATGPPGSAYALAGERYQKILARDGVQLRLVPTRGAIDNMNLLQDRRSGIDVGFLQAGSAHAIQSREIESLGTVFYEAVWVFCHCPGPAAPLQERALGWRASIGPPGSADRPLALKLLALNGVDTARMQLFAYSPEEAEKALIGGQLDLVLVVTGWESPMVQRLARAPDITLLSFRRADAYIALDPTLSRLTLPSGVADLAANRPPEDTTLIASKASLAVRTDVHPALQYLLLQAAQEVHSRPGMFHHAGEFPAAEEIDLPLSNHARQIYRTGPSFLQRSLPFWLAEFAQRLLILIVPVAGIIYPLWSLAPRLYNWQMQRRVSRMFSELKLLEREIRRTQPNLPDDFLRRLDDLERRALELKIPAAFTERTFNLGVHIRGLRERLRTQA